ncbi:DUF1996 domain-containing protein [Thermoactinospora rubra]|uniref:DUF1996 domain-containing protein n=1 Tax=Thermoactinospora rubra TaxID=1088767 RepID=UPI000A114D61|nr:DUF1996 domain-containing protein [Thermoactinospora rubra]
MRRSNRATAVISTLAFVAGGLVAVGTTGAVTVVGAAPALADHCLPGDHNAAEQNQQNQQDQRNRQQQQQNNQNQQDQQDQQSQQGQQGQDGQQDQQNQQDQQGQDGQQNQQDQQGQDGQQNQQDQQGQQGQQNQQDQQGQQGQQGQADPIQEPTDEPTEEPGGSPSPTATQEQNECADLGPFPEDFIDIRRVPPGGDVLGRSRGSFISRCGTNANGHNNPDNFIVAPGVRNGAHHLHDYVGNLSTDAFSTDESLAAAGTTCRLGDKSTYFWPVLRDRRVDDNIGDPDGNVGRVLRPRQAIMLFRGSGRVTAMPRFLRMITGDAKAATNGGANANAKWTCTGFTNRITTKYPLCPRGSQVVRILDFPSCWDGRNTDSANHRTHVVFPQGGSCPQGFRAIPQLRMILTYSVAPGLSYALDAFPEQKHNPITDHADFANVMPDRLMNFVVSCINRGRRC